jgi:hypothetical protein
MALVALARTFPHVFFRMFLQAGARHHSAQSSTPSRGTRASRNTADAFPQGNAEVLFRAARCRAAADKAARVRSSRSETSLERTMAGFGIHLATLDRLDHGRRLEDVPRHADALAALHPDRDGLLSSAPCAQAEQDISLFTWLNNGEPDHDWLIAGIERPMQKAERVSDRESFRFAALASAAEPVSARICRQSSGTPKRSAASAFGSMRGESAMWVSARFRGGICDGPGGKARGFIDARVRVCFPADAG